MDELHAHMTTRALVKAFLLETSRYNGSRDAIATLRSIYQESNRVDDATSVLSKEEETTEERLNREAGALFSGGVSGDILVMCIEYDRKYSLKELKKMCVEAGLSPSGHKKLLAAKLLAHQKRGFAPLKAI